MNRTRKWKFGNAVSAFTPKPTPLEALEAAPVPQTGEHDDKFIIRYIQWYRGIRSDVIDKAEGGRP